MMFELCHLFFFDIANIPGQSDIMQKTCIFSCYDDILELQITFQPLGRSKWENVRYYTVRVDRPESIAVVSCTVDKYFML